MSSISTPRWGDSLLRALDMPARESVALSRRGLGPGLGLAATGLLAVAASTAASNLLAGRAPIAVDGLRAALEALGLVVPALVVFAVYLRLALGPATLLASAAIGLFVAGVVTTSTVPLMAFLALVDRSGSAALALGIIPSAALIATATVIMRVIVALDPSPRARLVSWGFALVLAGAYVVRLLTQLQIV